MDKSATTRCAPYTRRAPSPPQIPIPIFEPRAAKQRAEFVMVPSYENVDPSQLTSEDLAIVTRNTAELVAPNLINGWKYEQRRQAQRILDFLYLGPNAAMRDHDFLKREGITMIMVVRDARMASRNLKSLDKASQALGIASSYIDVESAQHLIHNFTQSVRAINDHLLAAYHGQMQGREENGQMLLNPDGFVRGKVLVTCDSGNDLSAAIVAAYIMSVFGKDVMSAVHFISVQRFCACFDEGVKRLLLSWEEILRARATVARSQSTGNNNLLTKNKRGLEHLMDMDQEADSGLGQCMMDLDRFRGRDEFTPFADVP